MGSVLLQFVSLELLVWSGGKVHLLAQAKTFITLGKLVCLGKLDIGIPFVELPDECCLGQGWLCIGVAPIRSFFQVSCDIRGVDGYLGRKLSRV